MHRIARHILCALALLAALPAVAVASPEEIFEDCQDGRLDKRYSAKDYRQALNGLPTDIDEYTNCRDVIRRAQLGFDGDAAGGAGGSGGGGGGGVAVDENGRPIDPLLDATPEERAAVMAARANRTPKITAAGARPGDAGSALPLPLVIVLVLTAVAGLLLSGPRLRALVPGLRPA